MNNLALQKSFQIASLSIKGLKYAMLANILKKWKPHNFSQSVRKKRQFHSYYLKIKLIQSQIQIIQSQPLPPFESGGISFKEVGEEQIIINQKIK